MSVPWVAGRRKALARAVAIFAAQATGRDWGRMTSAERMKLSGDAYAAVRSWEAHGVLTSFQAEYREAEKGGTPLVQWPRG